MEQQAPQDDKVADNPNPVPDEIRKQAALIPRPIAIKFTVDGEVVVMGAAHPEDPKKMLARDLPLAVVEAALLPANWTTRHDFIMGMVYEACQQIKQKPQRKVPLTRSELIQLGGQKEELAKLVKWGFLAEKTIPVHKEGSSEKRSMAIVYFTPKGRAYIRKTLDPRYGLTINPAQESQDGQPGERGGHEGVPEASGRASDPQAGEAGGPVQQ